MTDLSDPARRASFVARVQGMLLKPAAEWDRIDPEPTPVQTLFTGYAAPLAAITPLCTALGMVVFGMSFLGVSVHWNPISALLNAIVTWVLALVSVFVLGLIIEALAPTFGGVKDRGQAMKVAVYSSTAAWLGGVFHLIPALGILAVLASLYSLYLLYLGLPKLMKTAQDKALGYTALVIVAAIVLAFVITIVVGALGAVGGWGMASAGSPFSNAAVTTTTTSKVRLGDATVDLGALAAASKSMEAQANAMQAQAAAAQAGVAAGSAGAAAAVAAPDALKALLPAGLNGWTRGDVTAESTGAAGLNTSHAEAVYARGGDSLTLNVTDAGAMGGVMGLAGALGVNTSKETSTGYEKVSTSNGRMTTEEYDRTARTGKLAVVAGRMAISAEGRGVSMDDLKAAVSAVDLNRAAALTKG